MFSRSSKSPASALTSSATGGKKTTFSLIGADVVIRGDLNASVDLHLDGSVEGDISCAGLVQGQESIVRGHVTAQAVRLAGTVEGQVSADDVIIERSARIVGDIVYGSISIENGAEIIGRFAKKGREEVQPPALPSPETASPAVKAMMADA